jgi:hypothetical protein
LLLLLAGKEEYPWVCGAMLEDLFNDDDDVLRSIPTLKINYLCVREIWETQTISGQITAPEAALANPSADNVALRTRIKSSLVANSIFFFFLKTEAYVEG